MTECIYGGFPIYYQRFGRVNIAARLRRQRAWILETPCRRQQATALDSSLAVAGSKWWKTTKTGWLWPFLGDSIHPALNYFKCLQVVRGLQMSDA